MNLKKEKAAWAAMKQRCLNPHSVNFDRYGGRGIKICERWIKSFSDFLSDVGVSPSRKHSIDRINNDGDYEPKNVRWATLRQQLNNKSNNRTFTHEGKTQTISEWSRESGIKLSTLWRRIDRGWSFGKSISTPIRVPQPKSPPTWSNLRFVEHDGRKQTLSQWSRETGISVATLWQRLNIGWSADLTVTKPVRRNA